MAPSAHDAGARVGPSSLAGVLAAARCKDDAEKAASVTLVLTLTRAIGLMAADRNGLSDPFVKLRVGDDEFKSKVCFKTLDPVWHAEFEFKATQAKLLSQSLCRERGSDGLAGGDEKISVTMPSRLLS